LLCGSIGELTGEHKVKASAIRSQFKTEKMVIGVSGDAERKFRPAQGPKSKEFHFESRICKQCNNRRTQPADREFDQFHSRVETLHREKRRLDLSRFDAAPVAHLSDLSFEGQGAFPAKG